MITSCYDGSPRFNPSQAPAWPEKECTGVNSSLSSLLQLSASQKLERGLVHTPGEIAQQPRTWLRTLDMLTSRAQEIQAFLTAAGLHRPPEQRPSVFLVGAGSSDYIGQSLHHLLRRHWQCDVFPVPSTSLLADFAEYVLPGRPALWISFSRSGDSPEGVAVLERALGEYPDIFHILVSCNSSGRMPRAVAGRATCLPIVLDDSVNDRGLAMTSSFTNMVVTGQFLARAWNPSQYAPILRALAAAGQSLLPSAADLAATLADHDFSRACFVGSGALAGTAMESALKMLELTAGRVLTMAQSTLGLRHGPMAALNPSTLLVCLVASDPRRRHFDLELLREIGSKSLVRTRVAVAADPAGLADCAEYVLAPERPPAIPDLCRPPLDVLFGQLLGLFASLRCGLHPDNPSPNGAISRVVSGVALQ
jgi:tagatose-6-phosphate ketose/aldose isomerase